MHRSLEILLVVSVILLSWCTSSRAEEPVAIEVAFTADADGTLQQYVVLLPPAFDPEAAHDVLIALHGHGSDRWQFVNECARRVPRGKGCCGATRDAVCVARLPRPHVLDGSAGRTGSGPGHCGREANVPDVESLRVRWLDGRYGLFDVRVFSIRNSWTAWPP